jgi:MFS family permease
VRPSPRWLRGGLLRQRNFRLLWFGETISGIGNAMSAFIVPLLAVSVLHAGAFAVTALTAAAYLPWLVIGLPAGAWADRLPPRALMLACDVSGAVLYASLPVAGWLGGLSIELVLAVALLAGAANVLFTTAYQVYLPSLVATEELIEGNAKLQGSASMALVAGRGCAGLAADAFGAAPAVLINAASFLVSACCLLRIRPPDRASAVPDGPDRAPTGRKTARGEIGRGIGFIARDPYLRPMTVYAAVGNLCYSGFVALAVLFLVKTAGLGSLTSSLLLSAGSAGGLAGALVARRLTDWFGIVPVLRLATLPTAMAGLLIPLTRTGPWAACYVAGAAVVSSGNLIGNIVGGAFRQVHSPPEMLGRVVAGMRFLAWGTIPVGALLGGALATSVGVRNALWIMLGGNALSALILLRVPRTAPAQEQRCANT